MSATRTAFVGRSLRGPLGAPTEIHDMAAYLRLFGPLSMLSPMGFAVHQYFANGGGVAVVVRVCGEGASPARFVLPGPAGDLVLEASSPGSWGSDLRIEVEHSTASSGGDAPFTLTVTEPAPDGGPGAGLTETFRDLSLDPGSPRSVSTVLAADSAFIRVAPPGAAVAVPGQDGEPITDADVNDIGGPAAGRGMYVLEDFDLLVIPPLDLASDVDASTWAAAAAFCRGRRAFLLIDPPSAAIVPPATPDSTGFSALTAALPPASPDAAYAAFYVPSLLAGNPITATTQEFAPSGAIAGVFARTDSTRGLWKAPSGREAAFSGIVGLAYPLSDAENGILNPLGANCLRTFPGIGPVVWGSRTIQGSDVLASDWKYIPVRRLASHIEDGVERHTSWVRSEPNDDRAWAKVRASVGSLMHDLFRRGAFQGVSPRDAYVVRCDSETTTQRDIDEGFVNILVGFAPLRPAEFVVLRIRQPAGVES